VSDASRTSPLDRDFDKYARLIESVPHMRALGIEVVSAKQGVGMMRLPYAEKLVGYPETGVIAGGAVLTLMDSVGGLAVWSRLDRLALIATLDLRIDYLRPAHAGEALIGEAECYRITRHIAFVRGHAHHGVREEAIAEIKAKFVLDTTPTPGVRQ